MVFNIGDRVHFEWCNNTADTYERGDGVVVQIGEWPARMYGIKFDSAESFQSTEETYDDLEDGHGVAFEDELTLIGTDDAD